MRTSRFVARLCVLALATGSAVALGAAAPASAGTGVYSQPGSVTIGQGSGTVGGGAIAVDDNGPAASYPSSVTVAGLVGVVTDVNVRLQTVTHAVPDDLDIMLVSPSGKRSIIMSDAGDAQPLAGVSITLEGRPGEPLELP